MALAKSSRSVVNSIVIVTGAASDIGRATTHLFTDEGAKVAVIDVNAEMLNEVVSEITAEGYDAKGWVLGLADRQAISAVIKAIAEHFGGIDILVNNAGISIPAMLDDDNFEATWDKTFAILLTAQTIAIRTALPYLRQAAHPRIINIASTEAP